jgi:ABC-2 type transport system permease protein
MRDAVARLSRVMRTELRIMRHDVDALLVLVFVPLLVMAFVKPAFAVVLRDQGYAEANGAEQSVPGIAVMFSFFLVGNVALSFYREYTWGTWNRLRTTSVAPWELLVGKVVPLVALAVVQQIVLFVCGWLIYGLRVGGSEIGLALAALALAVCLVSFGLAVVAVTSRFQQVTAVQTIGTMVFAGLGGAITPVALLPDWAQAVSRITPTFWALHAYRSVILETGGVAEVLPSVGVLLGLSAAFLALALWRFNFAEVKPGW